ncbi:hypothetical protein PHYBLDRAFT_152049 [Phycomyces blakesleeanus NRRL 1555(-)]|uniref:Uncharacterized protein n=1 Tax=Phycomyces blakesleeanus (strain ATCC 8743b / DSM 1359 / FGSC 10004 / NBRC 33097 / NRRL 1555) TaxID=763407 RepID=A0A162T7U3_PHYB8|nr:hypothetical protein PHYBLDRAFT_152049 [Phycomyces blakesleeanus NRRL 1555(-)]OAD66782.1 hypothetical protein PHYBLDRAFT_152049 [Phycomyces blakesleeanus NRRL 1555(-)]|eukprot:XP_018284822.1 hypothetical protein PHYBLDRAFT_152049 [Phycomyces blakesleeanus NRRL 1555(-)]
MLDVSILIKDNEPLPPTIFSLTKKPMSPMSTTEYNCLVGYYQVAYNDKRISSCKNGMTSSPFIQYIFIHSFTPTNSPTTLYNHNYQLNFAFVK